MSSFARMATHTCQLLSPPAVAGGKRGGPMLSVPDTACFPLDYVSAEVAQRIGIDSPARLRQTFIDGTLNVPRGSILVMDGKEYPVKSCAPWDWIDGSQFTHLVVEATEA